MANAQNKPDDMILLDVRGRMFGTLRCVVDRSKFLHSLTCGRWDQTKQTGGSYFVDTDPGRFEHILAWMRNGTQPIFRTDGGEYDYTRYGALLCDARYLNVQDLVKWIEDKGFIPSETVFRVRSLRLPLYLPAPYIALNFPDSSCVAVDSVEVRRRYCTSYKHHTDPALCSYRDGCYKFDSIGAGDSIPLRYSAYVRDHMYVLTTIVATTRTK